MSRRSQEEHHIRSLTKLAGGTTYAVTIPIEIVRDLDWQPKQKLVVKRYGEGIIISKHQPEKKGKNS